jgi:hypothetical protein
MEILVLDQLLERTKFLVLDCAIWRADRRMLEAFPLSARWWEVWRALLQVRHRRRANRKGRCGQI